jgi:hypothetical protein
MIRQRETRRDDFFTRYEPASVPQHAEAREREGRTEAVPAKSLSAEIIVGGDGEARVQVESVARDGFVDIDERSRGLGWPFAVAGVVLDILENAALRGELGEHLREGAALRVVRGMVIVLGVAALAKPRRHAQRDPLGKDVELRATRRAVGDGPAQGVATKVLDRDALVGLHRRRGVQVEAGDARVQALLHRLAGLGAVHLEPVDSMRLLRGTTMRAFSHSPGDDDGPANCGDRYGEPDQEQPTGHVPVQRHTEHERSEHAEDRDRHGVRKNRHHADRATLAGERHVQPKSPHHEGEEREHQANHQHAERRKS